MTHTIQLDSPGFSQRNVSPAAGVPAVEQAAGSSGRSGSPVSPPRSPPAHRIVENWPKGCGVSAQLHAPQMQATNYELVERVTRDLIGRGRTRMDADYEILRITFDKTVGENW